MIELDGSYLEGGGQILRTGVGMSAVTGRQVRIVNIRKGRKRPGLAAQHVCGIRAVAGLCAADLRGDELGSAQIEFRPGALDPPPELRVEVGTAGAVTLVLQALLVPLSQAPDPVSIALRGGTHVKWSPSIDYFDHVFGHYLRTMGCALRVAADRWGFYPKGGGRVQVTLDPGPLKPLTLTEPGARQWTRAWPVASSDLRKADVARRMLDGVERRLPEAEGEPRYMDSPSTGAGVLVAARLGDAVLGASELGERGVPAETVGAVAAIGLRDQLAAGACLDEHMADQILPYLALASGESLVSVAAITDHCRTNMWVIERFLPVRFEVDEAARTIACRGS